MVTIYIYVGSETVGISKVLMVVSVPFSDDGVNPQIASHPWIFQLVLSLYHLAILDVKQVASSTRRRQQPLIHDQQSI